VMGAIRDQCCSVNHYRVPIIGDMNADFSLNSKHVCPVKDFCYDLSFAFSVANKLRAQFSCDSPSRSAASG
jgi:hypothetical protein